MRLGERSGTFLPTLAQHHLLRASLLRDRDAVHASLAEWNAFVNLDDVDLGSFRLLPLLYTNLRRHGIEHESMPRLRGFYRRSWMRNQIILDRGLRTVRALGQAGIPTLLLKGSALAASAYDDPAQRPMDDLDVLVAGDDFLRAITVLEAMGWNTLRPIENRDAYFTFRHAVAFRQGSADLDLHKAPFRERYTLECERELWAAARSATFEGTAIQILDPADQLVQICAHAGLAHTNIPPIRWAADAWFLLSVAKDSLQWQRVVGQAGAIGCSLLLLRCLEYLRDGLGVNVPADTLSALKRQATLTSRFALSLANVEGRTAYIYLVLLWLRIVFSGSLAEVPGRMRHLPGYAREYLELAPDQTITRFVMRRLFRGAVA